MEVAAITALGVVVVILAIALVASSRRRTEGEADLLARVQALRATTQALEALKEKFERDEGDKGGSGITITGGSITASRYAPTSWGEVGPSRFPAPAPATRAEQAFDELFEISDGLSKAFPLQPYDGRFLSARERDRGEREERISQVLEHRGLRKAMQKEHEDASRLNEVAEALRTP